MGAPARGSGWKALSKGPMRVSSGRDAENGWIFNIKTTLLSSLTPKQWKMRQTLKKWGEGGLFVSGTGKDECIYCKGKDAVKSRRKEVEEKERRVRSRVGEKGWDSGHMWNA